MATIKDIAKRAGVTPSTVSRVLNQSGGYGEKTRQKVLKIANQLHYQRNEAAADLVAKRSKLIGVIVTNATTSFAAPIIDGIEDWAYQHGAKILLAHCGLHDQDRLADSLELMQSQRVGGIIAISVQFDAANRERLVATGCPFVSVGVDVAGFPAVRIDDEAATLAGTNYLLDRDYRRIALVAADPTDEQTGAKRCAGFRTAMVVAGLPAPVVAGDYSFAAGWQAAAELLAGPDRPDAIFAASDDAAAGVIAAANAAGLTVPADVAVLGFDDSYVAGLVTPALTTIAQPFRQMGQAAIAYLVAGEELGPVEFEIVERASVGQRD